jgi:formate--tetrahydrofolate ligase
VAINSFPNDSVEEIELVIEKCASMGIQAVLSEGWAKGGAGTQSLAEAVVAAVESGKSNFKPLYQRSLSVRQKIETIAKEIYRADGVDFTAEAELGLRRIANLQLEHLPVCMAKTEKSFSDDPTRRGRPTGFRITVRNFEFATGAGFVVPICGTLMRMPGLPETPAAEGMDIDAAGRITGLS